jgi:hypothetical protein
MATRRIWVGTLLVSLFLALCCVAQAQQGKNAPAKSDVTGRYEGMAKDEEGQDITVTLDLTEKDGVVTGMINSSHGDFQISNGSHKGDDVSLEFNANGTAGTISLRRTEDKLVGTWTAGEGGGPIDVKKVAAQQDPPKGKS